jgi:Squalene-hopene cyclase C-terminal domain
MIVTNSTEWTLRGLLDLYGCAVPRDALDAVLSVLQERAAPRWQFGISEFSLSFERGAPPKVRALAEVLTGSPTVPADALALQEIGGHLFETLQRQHRMRYDAALFEDLVQLTYGAQFPRFRPPKLRFGAAVEWRAGRAPSVKCYFDLFAGGQQSAGERLRRVFDRLKLGRQWRLLQRLIEDGDEAPPCRIIGVDFAPGGERNLRVYLPGSHYPLPRIRRLLEDCGGATLAGQLDAFNSRMLGGLDGAETARGMLIGLGFSDRPGAPAPVLKLDGYLPDHHADDFAASEAVAALAAGLGIPLPGHAEALRLLAPDTPLAGVQRLQQYCSLDIKDQPKLNLYFRPLVTRSEHLAPSLRPRLKPPLLADLDAACRKAIGALAQPAAGTGATLALLRAASAGFGIDRARIAGDLAALTELPGEDAATLAPLLQAALLAKAPQAEALCDDVLALLFDPAEAEGCFGSLVAETRTSDDRIRQAIGTWCAEGPEPAAMAELAYALALRGDARSLHTARAIAGFLGGRQHFGGLWRSAVAGGDFRVTLAAVRALSRLMPELPMLARTAKGLREAQRSDGGWGEVASEPMASAEALAACALLHDLDPEGAPALARGIAYLLRLQGPDGRWSEDDAATARCLEALAGLRNLVEQGLGAGGRDSAMPATRSSLRLVQTA